MNESSRATATVHFGGAGPGGARCRMGSARASSSTRSRFMNSDAARAASAVRRPADASRAGTSPRCRDGRE